jgi:predicted metalloprotease with PDZ domain
MIPRLILLVAASLFVAGAQAAGSAPPCALSYRFTPMWDTTPRRFEIEMSFDTGDRRTTELHATPEWAGITDFERAIRDVRPGEGAGTVTQVPGDSKTWRVTHAPGAHVTVKYDLANDVANVDAETALQHRDFFRPMLGASYFQVFGWAALLLPG